MQWLSDLKIPLRLGLGFGLLLTLLLAVVIMAVSRMAMVDQRLNHIVEVDARHLALATAMRDALRDQAAAIRDVVLQEDLSFLKSELGRMKTVAESYAAAKTELTASMSDARLGAMLDELKPLEDRFKQGVDEAVEHALGMDGSQAGQAIRNAVRPAQLSLIAKIDEVISVIESNSRSSAQQARGVYDTTLGLLWTLGIFAVVAGVLVSVAMVQTIVPPLRRAVSAAERIASYDLSRPHLPESKDEIGQLMHALSSMTQALSQSIDHIGQSANSFHASATEIASGTLDLSTRTEEAANRLVHTTTSMAELATSVGESSASASKANRLVAEAADVARQGGVVVREVVTTMNGIQQSSNKISDIIGVIDSIAFQTNILALNAAVEAARAGEQGRGFAVVASEVRSLAQRSAQAAQEIKALIHDSVGKVVAGTQLVDKAGTTMDGIVLSVQQVDEVIADMARHAQVQNQEIQTVHQAIAQLDQMTQQNAALVEQSTAASQSMREQAERLKEVVGVFNIEHRRAL